MQDCCVITSSYLKIKVNMLALNKTLCYSCKLFTFTLPSRQMIKKYNILWDSAFDELLISVIHSPYMLSPLPTVTSI